MFIMKRKYFTFFAVLLIVILVFAACGNKSGNESQPGSQAKDTSAEATQQPSEASTVYEPSKGLEFKSSGNGTCILTGPGTFAGDTLVIPSVSPDGDTVTEIDEGALSECKAKVLVLSGVTMKLDTISLSDGSFEEIIIEKSELNLESQAIAGCGKVTRMTVTDSKLTCDNHAFSETGDLAAITISDSKLELQSAIFDDGSVQKLSIDNCDISTGEECFRATPDLETIELSNSKIDLGRLCFYDCGNNMAVSISNCEGKIGETCFGKSDVAELSISDCTLEIGESAFSDLKNLKTILIGSGNIEIGQECFSYCESLKEVTISDKAVIKVGSSAFYGCDDNLVINYKGKQYTADTIEEFK